MAERNDQETIDILWEAVEAAKSYHGLTSWRADTPMAKMASERFRLALEKAGQLDAQTHPHYRKENL